MSPASDRLARPREGGPIPLISVIMPVRNAGATIGQQLAALAAQAYGGRWELIVADNGSSDGTSDVVRRWADSLPGVRTVDASARIGIGHARNAGAAAAAGQLLLFCDGDDMVAPSWIEAMGSVAQEADLVGGHIDMVRLNEPTVRHWRSPLTPGRLPEPMGLWPHVLGANFAVWRDVYQAVGGCDERFVAGGDDVDLSWRIQLAGGSIAFAPDAVVHYRLRGDLWATHRQLRGYGMGAALLYRKYRAYGAQRPPLPGTVKYWSRIVRSAPGQLSAPTARGCWVGDTAYHWGRIRGGLRHRVLFW